MINDRYSPIKREMESDTCSLPSPAVKRDLSLLLECVKFQMKYPELQKQALLTIGSVCEKKEDNVHLFRGMGGVTVVYSLFKSSIAHLDVKETALFTLGTLAETNVYCKHSLCRKETFSDLADWLVREDTSLTQKRVVVYLLSVLVANNKSGQTFAQTTGCLDILLDLFTTSFPFSTGATLKQSNITQTYQLWSSVSSALCGCVNNPQNEEGQRICVKAFPIVKTWLEQITLHRTDILKPICSFIAMTVGSNFCVQERFSTSGGLETLTLALVRLASEADKSLLSCQLSATLTKTLSACITGNAPLATGLAQYAVVPKLLSLLSSPNLDPEDRLPVVLTLGFCTEASEEHQSQLVQSGGLPPIITLLTESSNEELGKGAAFILQTCKQAIVSMGAPVPIAATEDVEAMEPHSNMESYWRSAREILHRIELLEKGQVAENEHGGMDSTTPAKELCRPPQFTAAPSHVFSMQGCVKRQIFRESDETQKCTLARRVHEEKSHGIHLHQKHQNESVHAAYRHSNAPDHVEAGNDVTNLQCLRSALEKRDSKEDLRNAIFSLSTLGERDNNTRCSQLVPEKHITNDTSAPMAQTGDRVPGHAPNGADVLCSVCKGTGTVQSSHVTSLEGAREQQTTESQEFKPPAPMSHGVPKGTESTNDHYVFCLCSEQMDNENSETGKTAVALDTLSHNRCSGCGLHFHEVTSRTFAALQSSCNHSCDLHKVLHEATERFRALHCKLLLSRESQQGTAEQEDAQSERASEAEPQRAREQWREVSLTPIHRGPKGSQQGKHHRGNYNAIGFTLTPLRRGANMKTFMPHNRTGLSLTPLKKPCLPEERRMHLENGGRAPDYQLKTQASRKPSSTWRKRKNFTQEEVRYLLNGVKTYGFSWNSILWSYPFQAGRANVDLAKKYRRLMAAKGN
ncbi:telomere repeats-binding bouquet formation protein 1 isoform X3 [Myripristis murdjan]|uniref:telomere repeats-binding bouquet formation protein 1 isoform X3 n=1 Tax=Myripristis murdjan TaxID=586833 RepID=UPI001175DBF1|nr:telomere repeats-binding bouquet formation protein 1 isoform X3 [Myripristis murdjan]